MRHPDFKGASRDYPAIMLEFGDTIADLEAQIHKLDEQLMAK